MPEWRFTGLEFELLWNAYGRDRLPYPLRYRPEPMDFRDLRQLREAAVTTLTDMYAVELERALDVLLEPDVRIEVTGLDHTDPARLVRFHGAIRANAGTALTQEPGPAPDTGADIVLRYGQAKQVPAAAVAALPARRPGTQPSIHLPRVDIRTDRDRPLRSPDGAIARLDRVFARPRQALGEVAVFPGSALDARPTPGDGFWWMDYDDGRYLVRTGDPIEAAPLGADAMVAEIERRAVRAQRWHRENERASG
ncbi:ESX secretion-associated protein EspG [Nocardia sp. NPDC057353]|uniref:ESX secretion-associated protein EspG n=1 Tax=Nocardia sp. NPDC057353 TaxID=3346104 RepID=UPI00363C5B80